MSILFLILVYVTILVIFLHLIDVVIFHDIHRRITHWKIQVALENLSQNLQFIQNYTARLSQRPRNQKDIHPD